jgi:hypothetical protein
MAGLLIRYRSLTGCWQLPTRLSQNRNRFLIQRRELQRTSHSINYSMLSTRNQIAFPDTHHAPAFLPKCERHQPIARNVFVEFRQPKMQSAFWRIAEFTPAVAVPKAAVHEQYESMAWEDEIRLAEQLLTATPTLKSMQPQKSNHAQLSVFVAASPNPGHNV